MLLLFFNTLLSTCNLKRLWSLDPECLTSPGNLSLAVHFPSRNPQYPLNLCAQHSYAKHFKTEELQYWYHCVRTCTDSCFPSPSSVLLRCWSNEIVHNYNSNYMHIFNKRPIFVLTSDKSPCWHNWAQGLNYTSMKLKRRGQNENFFSMVYCHFTIKQLCIQMNHESFFYIFSAAH